MTIEELYNSLIITNNSISLDTNVLNTDIWKKLLLTNNGNQPIVISQATKTKENGFVKIIGTTSFQLVPNLPVQATLRIDDLGKIQIRIYFNLIGETKLPNSWKFSQSFPKLPAEDKTKLSLLGDEATSVLDSLWLRNAYFVLSTEDFVEEDSKIPFSQGLNFKSILRPMGMLGVFDSILHGDTQEVNFYGRIILPLPTDLTPDLIAWTYPWEVKIEPPGILLKADLGADKNITDSLSIKDTEFVIYSPHSQEWLSKNRNYQPAYALTAILDIPSAKISCKVTGILKAGESEVVLQGDFQGVTLGKLADLLDITGSSDLSSNLPEEFSKAGNLLSDLALETISIGFNASLGSAGVSYAAIRIGFPNKTWKAIPGAVEFSDFSVLFIIASPFSATKRGISTVIEGKMDFGGVDLDVTAYLPNFSIRAELEEPVNLSLSKVFDKYFPELPSPPDISIDRFILGADAKRNFSVYAVIGEEKPWVLDLGPTSMTISDIEVDLNKPSVGGTNGSFSGTIQFSDNVLLQIRYDMPGAFSIRSEIDQIRLSELIARLSNQLVDLPGEFDLTFRQSSILISKREQDLVFLFGTQIDSFGSLAFEARKIGGGKWGYAFGLDLSSSKASSLPSLGVLSIFEDFFHLQKLTLVVSSFDSPDFAFPNLAQFENPRIASKDVKLPAQSGGLIQGLNIYGEWSINSSDRQQGLLSKFLGLNPVLGITLQVGSIPSKNSRLYVSYNTTIQGHPFSCKFGGQIQNNSIGIFLMGSLTVDIQGNPQTFDVTLIFVENGAFISATMKGNTSVNFYTFKLSNLALEVGINWEGIPSLGVAATIDVGEIESSVAVFFDSTRPSRSLVAGSISNVTLKKILDNLAGELTEKLPDVIENVLDQVAIEGTGGFNIPTSYADDLDNLKIESISSAFSSIGKISIPSSSSQVLLVVNKPGTTWYLTDLTTMMHYQLYKTGNTIAVSLEAQLYVAPENTTIGTLIFPAGFFINGTLKFFSFEVSAKILINRNQGIAVDAQMDRIVIVSDSLFCIQAAEGSGGPKLSVSSFTQNAQPEPKFRPPHFYINGELKFLGLKDSVFVEATKSGLTFKIQGNLALACVFDLHGSIGGSSYFSAGGNVKVGIGTIDLGILGSVHIDTSIQAGLDVKATNSAMTASLQAAFEFLGSTHNIGKFNLDVDSDPLTDLVGILEDKIMDILKGIFKDPAKWAEALGDKIIDGVEDAEKILTDYFHVPLDQAKQILSDAGLAIKACATTTAASIL
ncbi:hypothetical protein [Leptospira koniambonensis]|uniref:hypothetical protein n=1 Tax=Leptospira koniambonensis TaxID=2484950 RepID=UPI003EB781C6